MEHCPENLALVLKLLSISSTALAARLETDKSVVSRWLRGSVKPSSYNLSKLTAIVAEHVEGFRTLDWECAPDGLAQIFGVES